jgi:hypothetical protein
MRRRIVCILAMAIAVAFCFLKSYDISPTHYSLSGWTPMNGYVAETFVAEFDSAAEVDFFVGDVGEPLPPSVSVLDQVPASAPRSSS